MGLLAVLNEVRGTKLSAKLRNAMAMYDLMKTNPPESINGGFTSFTDSSWYFLDIRDEIEANPALLAANLAGTFDAYKSALKAAQESGERGWDRECAKWEQKNGRKYEPRPRPSLIGEPLE